MIEKVYISYFYQIRFFTPRFVPLSTAIFDPKWYHLNKGNEHIYKDKNGVVIGLRSELLHPQIDNNCCSTCKRTGNPSTCEFIKKYREQLHKIDFERFMDSLEVFLDKVNEMILQSEDDDLVPVFIVHEALDNPCSERVPLIEWFTDNDVECIEWSKDLANE